ncbi:UNVERIFIED_CONTAM: hypothetical protein GTU68_003864, partial [Idotea baltica]|nr:hypothetical protein [Idotea baltica]
CGIGLRFSHIDQILEERPVIPWLEVLSDNYLIESSVQQDYLFEMANHYPLVMHGVGMSLGSVDPLNTVYLQRLKALADRVNPAWLSDHLCWSSVHGMNTHDLIPLPYTHATINHVAERIRQAQDFLGRELIIENVSSYLQYKDSVMPEWEFFSEVAEAADCGMLLDINNIYVSACNHAFDAEDYLSAIPADRVRQFHLAGFEDRGTHLLDTHGHPVPEPVWELYKKALQTLGPIPSLIEWDNNIPALEVLLAEQGKAAVLLNQFSGSQQ